MSSDHTLQQTDEERAKAQAKSQAPIDPPADVPGYLFERRLGQGAYGEVWVAVDRNTGRRVAVKFYNHRGGVDWSLLSREVEKLAFLFADRYVVQLIDVGWDADPPYYVMEYLERGSLEDRIQQGPLAVAEAVEIFREVAVGLSHSHGKGVLHCDLKPANVLLDQDSKPRLADFGQSRLSHEQEPALGTLFYMAPEQADLQAVPDARWDVYALGAVLYCMLTGQPPHRSDISASDIEKSGGLEQRLAAYRSLVQSAPRPAAHRKLPGVDRELAEIVDRCLEIKSSRRYPNVQSVLDALQARALRRARRPLLVLGAIGPALLLGIMSMFALNGFQTAVKESEKILVDGSLETSRFAAQFVAENVAEKINDRWQALEAEADRYDLIKELEASAGQSSDDPPRQRLQSQLDLIANRNAHLHATVWVLYDAEGKLLASTPHKPQIIDTNFAYRDYFHGRGQDLPRDTTGLEPIQDVHLSNVFVAQSTGRLVVAFSAPIWNGPRDLPEHDVIGVLMMEFELGTFAELRSGTTSTGQQIAVLVDTRPVSPLVDRHEVTGGKGIILEHPDLLPLFERSKKTVPVYLEPDRVAELEALRAATLHRAGGVKSEEHHSLTTGEVDYLDSISQFDAAYRGRWLAAAHPVFVAGRGKVDARGRTENNLRDTGWVVIVQESYASAAEPVDRLKQGLVRRGLTAAGVLVFVLTGLWGFVMVGLNDASRSRIAAALRRRAGVKSTGSSTAESGNADSSPERTAPHLAVTQTMHRPLPEEPKSP